MIYNLNYGYGDMGVSCISIIKYTLVLNLFKWNIYYEYTDYN